MLVPSITRGTRDLYLSQALHVVQISSLSHVVICPDSRHYVNLLLHEQWLSHGNALMSFSTPVCPEYKSTSNIYSLLTLLTFLKSGAILTESLKLFDTDTLLRMMLGSFPLLDSTVLCPNTSHNRQSQAS